MVFHVNWVPIVDLSSASGGGGGTHSNMHAIVVTLPF